MDIWNYQEVLLVWAKKGFHSTKFETQCCDCGTLFETPLEVLRKKGLICRKCSISRTKRNLQLKPEETDWKPSTEDHLKEFDTLQNKWDTRTLEETQTINEKRRKTVQEKYGVNTVMESKQVQETWKKNNLIDGKRPQEIKDKIKKVFLEKYGVESPLHIKENQMKGVEASTSKEVRDKSRKTCLERYGVDNPNKVEAFREKVKKTCLERYGVENPGQSKQVQEKIKQTCLEKYGVETNLLLPGIRGSSKFLKYDGLLFDSNWELQYYKYCKEKGFNIKREPKSIQYFCEGQAHLYYPDFEVEGQLVEIKGDYFFNEKDELIDPYVKSEKAQKLAKAKYQCMLEQKVRILKRKDLLELGIKV